MEVAALDQPHQVIVLNEMRYVSPNASELHSGTANIIGLKSSHWGCQWALGRILMPQSRHTERLSLLIVHLFNK